MHFPHGESRLSGIEPALEENNNDSIINELNLLENGFESRVTKIQSFLYAQESPTPEAAPKKNRDSFLHDLEGNPIPPIYSRQLSPYNIVAAHSYRPVPRYDQGISTRAADGKGEDKKEAKKSIREEIMQENQLLERRLSLNKHYMTSFPSTRHHPPILKTAHAQPTAEAFPSQKKLEDQIPIDKIDELLVRLEDQYNRSKVVKLYNFILKEIPKCSRCDGLRIHLAKQPTNVSLRCKDCEQASAYLHPLIGVLYDLENKCRFEEEVSAFQAAIDAIGTQLAALQEQARGLEALREKLVNLKNLNRKKYKEINESKFYLRKHIGSLTQAHLLELQRLIPKEYLEQMEIWAEIGQQHAKSLQKTATALNRIMPAHLLEPSSRVLGSLHRLLNYEKEQAVKISVSDSIKFPMKRMECAVLVVDGSYSLPVFEDVRHLQLEFQNKKTLRELNLLFSNFPRQVHSLAFAYNHKLHSHISAEAFPFLRFVAALPALQKLHATIENVKDFADVLEMPGVATPKAELRLTVTRHIFSKASLNLPLHYYHNLFAKLGSNVTRIELDLPESPDSPAVLNYTQLLSLRYLCVFKLTRGEKQSRDPRKAKVLQSESLQAEHRREMVVKRAMATKCNFLRVIKRLSGVAQGGKAAIEPVLMFLL